MIEGLLADAVLVLHLLFILFVVLGGFFVWRWPKLAWLHLPAVVWGAWIELSHGICPLTPLENELRRRAGAQGYEGDFISHYLLPLIYPEGLKPETQMLLGLAALALNAALYWRAVVRAREGLLQKRSRDR